MSDVRWCRPKPTLIWNDLTSIGCVQNNSASKQSESERRLKQNLELDPDGINFWTVDVNYGYLYKFNIRAGSFLNPLSVPVAQGPISTRSPSMVRG